MLTSPTTDVSTGYEFDLLRVLADPLRIQIVRLLSQESLCTCHLVDETGARQTNVSNHLRVLREAGLVESQPCGRFTYYQLKPDGFQMLADRLLQVADAGRTVAVDDRRRPCP